MWKIWSYREKLECVYHDCDPDAHVADTDDDSGNDREQRVK